jgi:dephospho-CoA kinase
MNVLGLTGGIACGKTAVAQLFMERGVPVVDADAVARDVVAPGTDGLAAVVAAFGAGVLAPDGTLDRKRLGQLVFSDEAARRTLNGILHPRIGAESMARLAALSSEGHGFAFYDAALLVENGLHRNFAGLVVVTARPEVQLARLMARDGITEAEARQRVEAQWPLARKVAVATHVVDNSGTRERLAARVAEVYAELVIEHGAPARRERGKGP